MDDAEHRQRKEKIEEELNQLERDAGISENDAERAWGLAFMPYGIGDDEMEEFTAQQNNVLYFDSEHDDKARRVRKLYFGVADADARRKLIGKVAEMESLQDRYCRESLKQSKQLLWNSKQKEDELPWHTAAGVGVACVLGGYWIGNTVGAIAGAVAGVFVGMSTISNTRRDRKSSVAQAVAQLEDAETCLHELLTRPRFFNFREAQTGIKDDTYYVNAFGDRVQEFQARGNTRRDAT